MKIPLYLCCFGCCQSETELLPLYNGWHGFEFDIVPSASQAVVLVVSGFLTEKNKTTLREIYKQMPKQKYVVALGACALNGGLFRNSFVPHYAIEDILPVDVFVRGCPPSPEDIIDSLRLLPLGKRIRS
jgi:NADH:ubiquinone oxidoreductase subunit B-like Fe-S oxidoreductase